MRVSNLRVFSSAAHMKHFTIVNKVVLVERLRVGHSGHTGNEMCFPYIKAAIQLFSLVHAFWRTPVLFNHTQCPWPNHDLLLKLIQLPKRAVFSDLMSPDTHETHGLGLELILTLCLESTGGDLKTSPRLLHSVGRRTKSIPTVVTRGQCLAKQLELQRSMLDRWIMMQVWPFEM